MSQGSGESRPRFLVLGGLKVRVAGELIAVRQPKRRALLAALLIRPGRVVPTRSLVRAVWPEGPPASHRSNLRTHMRELRRLLGPAGAVLRTRPPGYALAVEPYDLDAYDFAAAVGEGRTAYARGDFSTAIARYEQALDHWRGDAYEDVPRWPELDNEIAMLAEQRLIAIEDLGDARLSAGLHEEVVGDMRALVTIHPLRERLHGQLMVALYRSGRQGDAVDAYHQARTVLANELGVEPHPELRRLHAAMLHGEI
ncbi:AfsR/SARP family transcriptional regulator [Actinoallomurus sp. CA-150999]|uniref:AfsR/SARP family transcriptional regulator n=1 Tax=Actinoallomurus sp. CA-150999 TaxID=3239887 RepID=UPI003D8FB74F